MIHLGLALALVILRDAAIQKHGLHLLVHEDDGLLTRGRGLNGDFITKVGCVGENVQVNRGSSRSSVGALGTRAR